MPKKTAKKNTRKARAAKTPSPKKTAEKKASTKTQLKFFKLPGVLKLSRDSLDMLWDNRRLFIWIALIYGLLNLILVQGLASTSDIASLRSTLTSLFHGHFGSLLSGISVFVVLVSSAGNSSSPTAGAYQLFLAIIATLAVVWSFRHIVNGTQVKLRDAFYQSMTPLIPFILVIIIIGLELIPFLIGSTLYSYVIGNDIVIGAVEQIVALIIFLLLAFLSLYWLISSIFALYIVTLPAMRPIAAIKSANKLVKKRRLLVFRKLIFLPFALLVVAAAIMLPIIIWLSAIATWVFFILTMFGLIIVNSYLYNLYRELLNASDTD